VTEAKCEDGAVKLAVDFDQLRQELSESIVEGPQERYNLNWPGKREALLTANAPVAKTLRPCREESVDFDSTQNLFIEGDNLDALKLLQETYLGKVKMIYIDPPYNTGNDFIYHDDFTQNFDEFLVNTNQKDATGNKLVANTESNGRFHSDWLSMMFPRIKLARNLLKEDGLIFISIDDCEAASLRKVCDEIFGEENFLAQIVWKKIYSGKADASHFGKFHEYILCYAKNVAAVEVKLLPRTEEMNARYSNPDNDPRGPWLSNDLTAAGERSAGHFEVKSPSGNSFDSPDGKHWLYSSETMKRLLSDNRIFFGKNGDAYPRLKRFLSEVQQGRKPNTVWLHDEVGHTDEGTKELRNLLGKNVDFQAPKPSRLIKQILKLATHSDRNEIVMDFFAGSGTTAQAVYSLNSEDQGNRRFVLVQIPQDCDPMSEAFKVGYRTIADITRQRMTLSGNKSKNPNLLIKEDTNIGFRVLKIDASNMADVYYAPDAVDKAKFDMFVDNIKPDRTAEDLLFQVMLDWGVDLALPIAKETIQGKEVFFVDGNALVACFDAQGGVDEEFVKALAKHQPLRVVFRDAGFKDSAVKINVEQIFKQLSPSTEVKCL
jgi:adenine-specific DNA-methyltransferase